MVGDKVGDLIIRLKNAGMVGRPTVSVPYSRFRHSIAKKLADAGYVADVSERGEAAKKTLDITLKYENGQHAINGVRRISKPGRRLYSKVADVHPVKFGKGSLFLSTPAGILTDAEARAQHVGGEQLFIIW